MAIYNDKVEFRKVGEIEFRQILRNALWAVADKARALSSAVDKEIQEEEKRLAWREDMDCLDNHPEVKESRKRLRDKQIPPLDKSDASLGSGHFGPVVCLFALKCEGVAYRARFL